MPAARDAPTPSLRSRLDLMMTLPRAVTGVPAPPLCMQQSGSGALEVDRCVRDGEPLIPEGSVNAVESVIETRPPTLKEIYANDDAYQ